MVYIDTPGTVPLDQTSAPKVFRGREFVHLVADSHDELVAFAVSVGCRPSWIQKEGTPYEHFDLTGRCLSLALAHARSGKIKQLQCREMATFWLKKKALASGKK